MKPKVQHLAIACLLALAIEAPSSAYVLEGQPAAAFTKQQLDYPTFGTTTTRTLNDYAGKVIFMFMMGYN